MTSRDESETIITLSAASSKANIFSTMPSWCKKISKMKGAKPCGDGWEVDIPKELIKLPPYK